MLEMALQIRQAEQNTVLRTVRAWGLAHTSPVLGIWCSSGDDPNPGPCRQGRESDETPVMTNQTRTYHAGENWGAIAITTNEAISQISDETFVIFKSVCLQ